MPRSRPRAEAGSYRSILVPVDGSRLSEQALPLAIAIAERARAGLRLIMVSTPAIPPSPEEKRLYAALARSARKFEKTYLKAFTDQIRKQSTGLAVSSTLLTGPVSRTLRDYVNDSKADLVVMTSRGQGGLRRLWLGSVADAMIRGSAVPVLLVRPEENPPPRPLLENLSHILVPLDGSAFSEAILDPARRLASLAGAELMLVQVIEPFASPLETQRSAPANFDVELTNLRRERATGYLKHLADRCLDAGVKASYATPVGGNVADTILGLAESPAVGLLAIATHGRGGIKRLALGSVADKLARTAPRPILVYRPPGRAKGRRIMITAA